MNNKPIQNVQKVSSCMMNASASIFSIMRSQLCSIIELNDCDDFFNSLNKIIYSLDKEKYIEHQLPVKYQDYHSLTNNTNYWIMLKSRKDFINVVSADNRTDRRDVISTSLKIFIYGPNRKQIRKKICEKMMRDKPDKGKIRITTTKCGTLYTNIALIQDIILPKPTQRYIISGLYRWNKEKEWYKTHGLTHKLGILMYGKPGTGKSTMIRAISTMFHRADIITVSAFEIERQIGFIIGQRSRTTGVMIIAIEDIDMGMLSRESIEESEHLEYPNEIMKNQQVIFQLLDGVYSMEDTIIIATTNHKNSLDEGLIRAGRFDMQIEFDYFDEDLTKLFLQKFGYDESYIEKMNVTLPISPAKLQSKIMEYRASEKTVS